ncbi:MAG: lipocalin family protein [Bacteroidales bacterium]|nr:lipocalin family protein [Bacteroidales bacterium]
MGTPIIISRIRFLILILAVAFTACKSQNTMIDKRVVKELDLNKYLGTWYEIARFDHRFERGLEGVTATYSLREDGKIKVVNSGYKGTLDGPYQEAIGKAKIPDPSAEPAKLKVSFFWIFYGDYYVLELEKNYQYAVIGSSSDKYLWILNRKPQMEKSTYDAILENLNTRGYDTSKLILVKQRH